MTNTSADGGFLTPVSTPPVEGDALDDFFQTVVVGITGIAGPLVRPRFQEEPPNLPPRATNWAAVGVVDRRHSGFAAIEHDGADEGSDTLTRHEELDILVSFYGPGAQAGASAFRDGIEVAQNREVLTLANMGLVGVGDLRRAPELIKNAWYSRTDLTFTVRRQIDRTYQVLNILTVEAEIEAPPVDTLTIIVSP